MRQATLWEFVKRILPMLLLMVIMTGYMIWIAIEAVTTGYWWFPLGIVVGWAFISLITWSWHKQAIVCECGTFLFVKSKYCPSCGKLF